MSQNSFQVRKTLVRLKIVLFQNSLVSVVESIDEGLQILQTVAESAENSADTTAHLISKKKLSTNSWNRQRRNFWESSRATTWNTWNGRAKIRAQML